MTDPGQSVVLKSRTGYPKPISPAQVAALATIADGDVYYLERFGNFMGVRADVCEVLERNQLLEVLDEPENPGHRSPRYRVVLTARGREIFEGVR